MGVTKVITATERQTLRVDQNSFEQLLRSPSVVNLIADGVLSLVRSSTVPFGVKAFNKVGQAVLDNGTRLVVQEKIPGALQGLLRWCLPQDIRESNLPSSVDNNGYVLLAFAHQFLEHLGEHLRSGRLKEYQARQEISSYPRGSLDIADTIKLQGRGRRGVLSFQSSELSADFLPNRLISVGLSAVETIGSAMSGGRSVRDKARGFATLFSDVHSLQFQRSGADFKNAAFRRVFGDTRLDKHLRDALAFARILILHLGSWTAFSDVLVSSSYFLNLETLFEEAVRSLMATTAAGTIKVVEGSEWNQPLFQERPKNFVANPDVVIGSELPPRAIIDCKYKDSSRQGTTILPSHDDVYQLLSHCVAFGGKTGILIYPTENFEYHEFGTTTNGIKIICTGVRVNALSIDVREVLFRSRTLPKLADCTQ